MRIGIDASNLRAGGGVTHLAELLGAADPPAHGVERVVVWGGHSTLRMLPEAPWLARVHDTALDGPLPRRLLWQRFELEGRARGACDLLYVPGGSYSGRFRPFVTMSRSLLPFEPGERQRYGASGMRAKLALLRLGQTATFRRADGLIFLNAYARGVVEAVTGPLAGEVTTIPHGVNPAFLASPRPQEALGRYGAERPFRWLYVSTIDLYKHQWHVVDACARLRARGLPVALDLVGGAYAPALERLKASMARADPDGCYVRYVGAVAHAALPALYRDADAFVFASSCENMPNVLLEAMASGLPIACAERGPMPSVLGDGGVYYDPEAPGSIAGALERLASDPDLRTRLALRAHHRAREFSWRRSAEATFGFLAGVHARAKLQCFDRIDGPVRARPDP